MKIKGIPDYEDMEESIDIDDPYGDTEDDLSSYSISGDDIEDDEEDWDFLADEIPEPIELPDRTSIKVDLGTNKPVLSSALSDEELARRILEKRKKEGLDASSAVDIDYLFDISNFDPSEVKMTLEYVSVHNISIPKRARKETFRGLNAIIKAYGVLQPISVIRLKAKDKYLLAAGYRRVYGALQNGIEMLPAIVYDNLPIVDEPFIAILYELLLNMSAPLSVKEKWEYSEYLQTQTTRFNPTRIEWLLQFKSGEYSKLSDIMTATEIEASELRDLLMSDKITIENAYRKLDNVRKKKTRDTELKEQDNLDLDINDSDALGVASRIANESAATKQDVLSSQDINSLLEDLSVSKKDIFDADDDLDTSIANIQALDLAGNKRNDAAKESYDKNRRKALDPKLRLAKLVADNYTCQCCFKIGGEQAVPILDFHHLVPHFLGGTDTLANGMTVCLNCHQLIHVYAFGMLVVDWNNLAKEDLEKYKNVLTFGNVIIKGMERMKEGDIKEARKIDNPAFKGRLMPGTIVRELETGKQLTENAKLSEKYEKEISKA